MTLTPEQFLDGIPGWEGSVCRRLTGGLSNTAWQVSANGRVGVLKLDTGPRRVPLNTRGDEARVQNMAAKTGLAANVISAGNGFYFTEYVEGTVWDRDSLEKAGNLELIAAALKRLHALPLSGRAFDAKTAARQYVDTAIDVDAVVVKKCNEIVANTQLPGKLRCCHNDLVAENIVTTPALMFLDWEYSCDNDPFFDLAIIVEHHELDDSQSDRLLGAYVGDNGHRWRARFEQQRRLYLALLCLWMGSRPDSDPVDRRTVRNRLLTRCS